MFRQIKLTYKKLFYIFNKKAKHQLDYYYYEQLFNRYRKKDCYIQIYQQLKQQQSVATDVSIKLSSKFNTFHIDLKTIEKKYGKPSFRIKQKRQEFDTEFLLYRTYLGKHKAKLEMHFYQGQLAFYCYRLSHINANDLQEIQHTIEDKYGLSGYVNFENQHILDNEKIALQISQDGDLLLRYISTSSPLFQALKKDIVKQEAEKKLLEKHHLKALKRQL